MDFTSVTAHRTYTFALRARLRTKHEGGLLDGIDPVLAQPETAGYAAIIFDSHCDQTATGSGVGPHADIFAKRFDMNSCGLSFESAILLDPPKGFAGICKLKDFVWRQQSGRRFKCET
jgi:hypothetical protein